MTNMPEIKLFVLGLILLFGFCVEFYQYLDVFWSVVFGLGCATLCIPAALTFQFKMLDKFNGG